MAEFFDYDPVTGITDFFDFDEMTNTAFIHSVQDVEPLIERNKAIRNQGLNDSGIKESWWHVATVPAVVIMELKRRGLDIFNPDHEDRIAQELRSNYRNLCLTDKKF